MWWEWKILTWPLVCFGSLKRSLAVHQGKRKTEILSKGVGRRVKWNNANIGGWEETKILWNLWNNHAVRDHWSTLSCAVHLKSRESWLCFLFFFVFWQFVFCEIHTMLKKKKEIWDAYTGRGVISKQKMAANEKGIDLHICKWEYW